MDTESGMFTWSYKGSCWIGLWDICILDSHITFFSGFFEQVSWSTCFEGASKKNRPGHLNYKVLTHMHFVEYLIIPPNSFFIIVWNIIHTFTYFSKSICAIMGSKRVLKCLGAGTWCSHPAIGHGKEKVPVPLVKKPFLGLNLFKENNGHLKYRKIIWGLVLGSWWSMLVKVNH